MKRQRWTSETINPQHRAAVAKAELDAATGRELRLPMVPAVIANSRPSAPEKVKGKTGRRSAKKTKDSTGWIHPSKLQATVTDRLRLNAHAVIPEVSMPLSQRPNDRIRLDCLVIEKMLEDGRFVAYFADPKGFMEDSWKQKARRFADTYEVPILVIHK